MRPEVRWGESLEELYMWQRGIITDVRGIMCGECRFNLLCSEKGPMAGDLVTCWPAAELPHLHYLFSLLEFWVLSLRSIRRQNLKLVSFDHGYEDCKFLLSAHFVTKLILISLLNCAVHLWVGLDTWKCYCCCQMCNLLCLNILWLNQTSVLFSTVLFIFGWG